ncbi:MAG: carboxymuconolactone decarboxylase family protein [Actinomycetota bacterium]
MARVRFAELPNDLPITNNLVRCTYNNPEMHRGFASLAGRVHSASRVPDRVRELVVLSLVASLGADYEWDQHSGGALRMGVVSEAELTALQSAAYEGFTPAERAAIEYGLAVEARTVTDTEWANARSYWSEAELTDMTMLAGFYGLASRFVMALAVDLERPEASSTMGQQH